MIKSSVKLVILNVEGTLQKQAKDHRYISALLIPLFIFLLFQNLIGILPYGYTTTAQFVVSFSLSLPLFIQSIYTLIIFNRLSALLVFLPKGVPIPISVLIVGIETLSLLSRIVSLAMRLTANMISGHTLLKMISTGIASGLTLLSSYLFLTVPLAILVPLAIMELGIAFLQAYVFIVLTLSYFVDSYYLH